MTIESIAASLEKNRIATILQLNIKELFEMSMTQKDRAIEVLQWSVGLVACAALLFVLIAGPIFYVDGESEGAAILTLLFLGPLATCAGLYMVGNYVIYGTKKRFLDFFQIIWGKIPAYLWFFLTVLYIWGLGTAIGRGADDAMIFGSDFSEGVGAGLAAFVIGGLGRFFRPNKLMGHIVITILIVIVSLLVL